MIYRLILRYLAIVAVIVLPALFNAVFATHIMGGNLELKAVNNKPGQYKIILKQYIDETEYSGSIASFSVTVHKKSDNSQIETFKVKLISQKKVIYENETCTTKRRLKTAYTYYEGDAFLDPQKYSDPQGYYISWSSCCRNAAIINIRNPHTSSCNLRTYFPPLIKKGKLFVDSSPAFEELDGAYICNGEPFYFPFDAKDADGDELRYSMQTPLGYNNNYNAPVKWVSGYSAGNAIPGKPALKVNAKTGELFVIPNQVGLFVFSVMVEEFRNGERIGSVQRDYQLYVVDCPPIAPPRQTTLVDNKVLTETSVCQGKTVILSSSRSDPDWNYQWKRNGKNIENATNDSLIIAESGEYQLVTSLSGTCSKTSRSAKVKIDVTTAAFPLKYEGKPQVCGTGGKITLHAPRNGNYSYQWFRNGMVVSNPIDSLVAAGAGNYWAILTDVTQGCKSFSDTVNIKEMPVPPVSLNVVNGRTSVCEGDSVLLNAIQNNDYAYSWQLDQKDLQLNTNSIYADQSGKYTVTVRDSTGCPNTSNEIEVIVSEKAKIDFSAVSPLCAADNASVQLLATPSGGTFQGKGVKGDLFDPKQAGAGLHEITYTTNRTRVCPSVTSTQQITVWGLPHAETGEDIHVPQNESAYIGSESTSGNTYNWTPSDYLDDALSSRPRVTPINDTEYTLEVTDINGCTTSGQVMVRITYKVWIPDAFSPNADGINETWELKGINRYPEAEVTIYNHLGQTVFYSKGYTTAFDGKRNGDLLSPGQYMYTLKLDTASPVQKGTVMLLR